METPHEGARSATAQWDADEGMQARCTRQMGKARKAGRVPAYTQNVRARGVDFGDGNVAQGLLHGLKPGHLWWGWRQPQCSIAVLTHCVAMS